MSVHPAVERAASGELPEWAVTDEPRRAHMSRVADLLGCWSDELSQSAEERLRWVSVGYLHDALREEDPDRLRPRVPVALRTLPDLLLHGPAASERLRVDGVLDGELLRAVAYHTVGDASFGSLGRALYAADFLEPGRKFLNDWRAELRERMPADLDRVVFEIAKARVAHLVDRGLAIHPQTVGFWNGLAEACA